MKKKIKIEKDEIGCTWRTEIVKSADSSISIVSTKISGFRHKIDVHTSMVSQI